MAPGGQQVSRDGAAGAGGRSGTRARGLLGCPPGSGRCPGSRPARQGRGRDRACSSWRSACARRCEPGRSRPMPARTTYSLGSGSAPGSGGTSSAGSSSAKVGTGCSGSVLPGEPRRLRAGGSREPPLLGSRGRLIGSRGLVLHRLRDDLVRLGVVIPSSLGHGVAPGPWLKQSPGADDGALVYSRVIPSMTTAASSSSMTGSSSRNTE